MTALTETAAGRHLAAHALVPSVPGFVGLAVDLPLSPPGLPFSLVGSLAERPPLRHGFLTARSARLLVVSGPPSPGVDVCAARMAEDLAMPGPLVRGHGITVPDDAGDAGLPVHATAGIRVALEAGTEDPGPYGMGRRWAVAHAVAPVLAAAFANSPLRDGRPTGLRSNRQALRHHPAGPLADEDPRDAWARQVLDAPVAPGRTFREWIRGGRADRPGLADLRAHVRTVRPPVAARGHLEIDVADRQPGDGWRVPLAVVTALIDDPLAGAEALAATAGLHTGDGLWDRAARHGLADAGLAAAARSCFLSAYGALSRQGAGRDLRDAVATFLERYVLRGRCPADDVLDRRTARP